MRRYERGESYRLSFREDRLHTMKWYDVGSEFLRQTDKVFKYWRERCKEQTKVAWERWLWQPRSIEHNCFVFRIGMAIVAIVTIGKRTNWDLMGRGYHRKPRSLIRLCPTPRICRPENSENIAMQAEQVSCTMVRCLLVNPKTSAFSKVATTPLLFRQLDHWARWHYQACKGERCGEKLELFWEPTLKKVHARAGLWIRIRNLNCKEQAIGIAKREGYAGTAILVMAIYRTNPNVNRYHKARKNRWKKYPNCHHRITFSVEEYV